LFANNVIDNDPAPIEETTQDETASPLMEALADLNPDEMSPREALNALYRLKALITQRAA